MPIPLDTRKKPLDVGIHVSTGTGVDITWADGHRSHFDFAYLRDLCPCATCNDERHRKEEMAAHTSAGPGPQSPSLPMFKPKPRARAASAVGSYAIRIDFTDGHSTGIYSFEYLREICPCAACAREFRSNK
ncbi:MAG TPA: DUF971 domain-containing protein [Candidatus Acidoferrales bacterium]